MEITFKAALIVLSILQISTCSPSARTEELVSNEPWVEKSLPDGAGAGGPQVPPPRDPEKVAKIQALIEQLKQKKPQKWEEIKDKFHWPGMQMPQAVTNLWNNYGANLWNTYGWGKKPSRMPPAAQPVGLAQAIPVNQAPGRGWDAARRAQLKRAAANRFARQNSGIRQIPIFGEPEVLPQIVQPQIAIDPQYGPALSAVQVPNPPVPVEEMRPQEPVMPPVVEQAPVIAPLVQQEVLQQQRQPPINDVSLEAPVFLPAAVQPPPDNTAPLAPVSAPQLPDYTAPPAAPVNAAPPLDYAAPATPQQDFTAPAQPAYAAPPADYTAPAPPVIAATQPDYTAPAPPVIAATQPDYTVPAPPVIAAPQPDYTAPAPPVIAAPQPDYTAPAPPVYAAPQPDYIKPAPVYAALQPDYTAFAPPVYTPPPAYSPYSPPSQYGGFQSSTGWGSPPSSGLFGRYTLPPSDISNFPRYNPSAMQHYSDDDYLSHLQRLLDEPEE